MTQTRSLRWLSVGVSVCLVIGAIVVSLGATTVTAQRSENISNLNGTGDPNPLIIDQSNQNISNIKIVPEKQRWNVTNFTIWVDLASIDEKGANVSNSSLSIKNIKNGNLSNTARSQYKNHTWLKATLHPNNLTRPVYINSLQISGIDTSNAQRSGQISYNISITNASNPSSIESAEITDTNSFKIIGGNIEIHDQATGSPQLHSDTRTSPGITIDDISGNTNSTLFITRGQENEIIELEGIPEKVLNKNQAISVYTPYLGGDITGYLVANSTLESSNFGMKDNLPPEITRSALSTDGGRIVAADVKLSNRSYESARTDKITIPSAKVSDTIEDETPYIVSLHPVDSSGHLLRNVTIASSRVLTGWSDNVNLYFNSTNTGSGIFRSNRYVVAIQLTRGHSAGEVVHPKNFDILRNSDLDNQFVPDGVADVGTILIKDSAIQNSSSTVDSVEIASDQPLDEPVYSGVPIYFRARGSEANNTQLRKVINKQKSRVVSLGTRLNNSPKFGYNTSLLSSGQYYISSEGEDSRKFEIIGNGDKNVRFNKIEDTTTYGSHIRILVSHSVPDLSLNLSTTPARSTTLNLTTSDTGPTPISINTYASPSSPADFVTTGSGITVDSVSGDLSPLSPGTYTLTLRSEHGTAVTNDTATVSVEPRSTTDLTAYTTRAVSPDGFENATAVREAITDGTLTPATTATENDTVVYAANATGLTGLVTATNASLNRGADLDRLDGLSFGVAPVGTNDSDAAGGTALGPTPNESAVYLDRRGLFLVTDGEAAFGTETPPAPGETFEATFRVDDERLRRAAGDDRHRVTTRLTSGGVDSPAKRADNETLGVTAAVSPTDNGSTGSTGSTESFGSNRSVGAEGQTESGPSDRSDTPGGSGTSAGPTGVSAGSVSASDSGGTGSAGASGSAGSTGSTGGTGSGGSPIGGGGSPDRDTPVGTGNATDGGSPAPSGRPSDSGVNLSTAPPGIGITVGPNGSETPLFGGPPGLLGSGRIDLSVTRSAAEGTDISEERSDGRVEGNDARSPDGPESMSSSAERDSSSGGATATDIGYEEAPIRSTVYDLPGFGAVPSLAALTGASLLARRRVRGA